MTSHVPVALKRKLAALGWVDCGDNHWSKEHVGYIRRHPERRDVWLVSEWNPIVHRDCRTLVEAVERAEFDARAGKQLDRMMAYHMLQGARR